MKKISSICLQAVIVLIAIGSLVLLLWEPQIEGRNAQATLSQIYFNDPFLLFAYIGSTPFFVALSQAFKVLGLAKQNKLFSFETLKALRTMKYCGIFLLTFVAIAELIIMLNDSDDRAGGVFIGFLIAIISIMIASISGKFEKILQNNLWL